MKNKRRDSSSSSDDMHAKKLAKKRMCQKRDALKLASKSGHSSKKLATIVGKSKKHSLSNSPPPHKKQRVSGGSSICREEEWTKTGRRLDERLEEGWTKGGRQMSSHLREKEKEKKRERMRMLEKECIRSRSPKICPKSRTPTKRRTPPPSSSSSSRRQSPAKPPHYGSTSRPLDRRMDSRERERRDKERQDREAAREKERREALARCQERQRERERLAKEKSRGRPLEDEHPKIDRLLPRPAERAAMALAAARGRSRESIERDRRDHPGRSIEKDMLDSYGSRSSYSELHQTSYGSRRHEKESIRDTERSTYEESLARRDDRRGEYQASSSYADEQTARHRGAERERRGEWIHDENYDRSSDRHQSAREWEHGGSGRHAELGSSNRDNYAESWISATESASKWERRESHGKPSNWQQPEGENWDRYNEDGGWNDVSTHPKSISSHSRGGVDKVDAIASAGNSPSTLMGKGIVSRRWNTWRGRGRGSHHHGEFRRTNVHHSQHTSEGYEERGDVYRRHINPQGNKTSTDSGSYFTLRNFFGISITSIFEFFFAASKTPAVPAENVSVENTEKTAAVADEIIAKNEEAAEVEEIADDLSEISDEADDILNQQEVNAFPSRCKEKENLFRSILFPNIGTACRITASAAGDRHIDTNDAR